MRLSVYSRGMGIWRHIRWGYALVVFRRDMLGLYCGDVGKCVSAEEMRFCVSTGSWETCISWCEKYVLWLCVTSLQMDELGPRIIGYVEVISYVVCWR